jgi:hypothetical protein
MSADRALLHTLVDSLSDSEIPVVLSFLSEFSDEEVIDAETTAKLDLAETEPGPDIPFEEVRRLLKL